MQSNSYFQQIKTVATKGIKTIRIFGISSMAIWAILLSLWVNSIYLRDWNILNSVMFLAISACVFLLMTALGVIVISSVLVLVKMKGSNFIYSFLGLSVALPLIKAASAIIWMMFYSNGSAYSAGELSSNPLFLIPNILTVLMLAYVGWKLNGLMIIETNLPIKE